MKHTVYAAIVLHCIAATLAAQSHQALGLERHFGDQDACMVLLDVRRNILQRYRPERCNERLSPCSTFKVPHALIGLHTGVLRGPDHLRPWNGVETWNPAWNRDHTLATAIRDSAFWYFQATAADIGDDRMRESLRMLNYGDQDIAGGLTQFWLESSLTISANEQVMFLRDLAQRKLPFNHEAQATVAEMLIQPQYDGPGTLYGKTGTGGNPHGKTTIGWFVGWLECGDEIYVFAVNAKNSATGRDLRQLTMKLLPDLMSEAARGKPRR